MSLLSAAHCFQVKGRPTIKAPQDVSALVGKHNLRDHDESGSSAHKVWDIVLNKDWDYNAYDYDADISLVVLQYQVDLSDPSRVGVICLPLSSQNEMSGSGTVVGWGISEKSIKKGESHDSTPNELKLPAVAQSQCFDNDDRFVIASSNRTFCAGFVNQNKSACQGDSGGGWFSLDWTSKAYNLAGIVSASLNDPFSYCVSQTYSIFTDVTKFVDWIENTMEETKEVKWDDVEFWCEYQFG